MDGRFIIREEFCRRKTWVPCSHWKNGYWLFECKCYLIQHVQSLKGHLHEQKGIVAIFGSSMLVFNALLPPQKKVRDGQPHLWWLMWRKRSVVAEQDVLPEVTLPPKVTSSCSCVGDAVANAPSWLTAQASWNSAWQAAHIALICLESFCERQAINAAKYRPHRAVQMF